MKALADKFLTRPEHYKPLLYLTLISLFFGISVSLPKINLVFPITVLSFFILMKEAADRKLRFAFADSYYFVFVVWSLIGCLWSQSLIDGIKQSIFIFICAVLIKYCSDLISGRSLVQDVFKKLSYLVVAHLIISLLEIYTSVRWPISAYSKFSSYFGRLNYYVEGIDESILQSPTSFFWGINECGLVSLMILPFALLAKRAWVRFLLLTAIQIVIYFSLSKAFIFMSPILLYLSFLALSWKDLLKRTPSALLGLLLVLASHYTARFTFEKTTYVSDIKAETEVSLFDLCYYTEDTLDLNLNCLKIHTAYEQDSIRNKIREFFNSSEPVVTAKEADDLRAKGLMNTQLRLSTNERAVINKTVLKNTPRFNFVGIGPGSLKTKTYELNGKNFPLIAPHHYWLELYSEYGTVFALFTIIYFVYLAATLISIVRNSTDVFIRQLALVFVVSMPFFILGLSILASFFFFFTGIIYFILIHSLTKTTLREPVK